MMNSTIPSPTLRLSEQGDKVTIPGIAMSELPNVAFIGRAGSGKTTATQFLESAFEYRRLSFADTLRQIAYQIWGDPSPKDRGRLQKLGYALREIDENALVYPVITELSVGKGPFAIDDCRFPNEQELLAQNGFVFVRIIASEDTRVTRLQRTGKFQTREQLEHESESAIDTLLADYSIENEDDDLLKYHAEIAKVLERERRRT